MGQILSTNTLICSMKTEFQIIFRKNNKETLSEKEVRYRM